MIDQFEEFCSNNKVPESIRLFWIWLDKQLDINSEVEPDLTDFNQWIKSRRGKGYCRNTLKKLIPFLERHKILSVRKKYSWKIYRLQVKSIDFFFKSLRKSLEKKNKRKALSLTDKQQVAISRSEREKNNRTLLEKCHIPFAKNFGWLATWKEEEVKGAIVKFVIRGGFKQKPSNGYQLNPQGFIIQAIRDKSWAEYDDYYSIFGKPPSIEECISTLEEQFSQLQAKALLAF